MLFTLILGLLILFLIIMVSMTELREMARVTLFGSSNNRKGTTFEPARDIPSLAGKVILITGAAGDLGRNTAIQLARYGRPARIYIADLPCDEDAQKALAQKITSEAYGDEPVKGMKSEIRYLDLDLSSFKSVRKCAVEFAAQEKRLDILYLNAGIIRVAPAVTKEGYEQHFGINYLGHALLALLLVPTMVRTAKQQPDVRIVVVSSEGHLMTPKGGIDFSRLKTDGADIPYAKRYGQSKVALLCLTRELANEYPQVKFIAVHPGRILTGMATSLQNESSLAYWTKPIAPLFCVPVKIGILNHLWAGTSSNVVSGMYYEPVGVPGTRSDAAKDEILSERLREWTDDALSGIELLR